MFTEKAIIELKDMIHRIRAFIRCTPESDDLFKYIHSHAKFLNERWGIWNEGGFLFGINKECTCMKIFFNAQDITTEGEEHGWQRNITYEEFKQVLYLLESMGLNLSDTSVSYIEVGATLQTDKEPKSYFNCLGRLPYFTKQTTYKSTTLYYNTPKTMNKSIIFYDKRKQIENKREARYKDQEHGIKGQYLRYELRMLKKSIREDKRIKSISTLQDLLDRNKYECLINRWQDYYLKIKKTKERPQRESELQGKITKAVQAHLKNTQIINR